MSQDNYGIFMLPVARVKVVNNCSIFFLYFRDVPILQLTVKFYAPLQTNDVF